GQIPLALVVGEAVAAELVETPPRLPLPDGPEGRRQRTGKARQRAGYIAPAGPRHAPRRLPAGGGQQIRCPLVEEVEPGSLEGGEHLVAAAVGLHHRTRGRQGAVVVAVAGDARGAETGRHRPVAAGFV